MACNTLFSWHENNEAFLTPIYHDMGKMRRLMLHILYHVCCANYKNIIFSKGKTTPYDYMLEPIPLSTIRTIASMQLGSHTLRCEMGCCVKSDESNWLFTLWYNALPLISLNYAFHTSLTKLNSSTNFSHNHNVHSRLQHSLVQVLQHQESLLTFTCIMWNAIFFASIIFDLQRH